MKRFMMTDDPHLEPQVHELNILFNKWDDYLYEMHRTHNHQWKAGRQLTLYLDQGTYHELQCFMGANGSVGPLTVQCHPSEPLVHSLFGIPVVVIVVCYHSNYDHLTYK